MKLLGISKSFCLRLLERKRHIRRVKSATQHTGANAITIAMARVDSLYLD